MKKLLRLLFSILVGVLVTTPLAACQPAATPIPPTLTPLPTATPTITPTPLPREMDTRDVLKDCEELDRLGVQIILDGMLFLPEGAVYGYEGWYGMELVSSSRIRVLFEVGSEPNKIQELPFDFQEQDLVVQAEDGQLIRHGHLVRITGKVKYRPDSELRMCEVFVERAESLMPEEILDPVDQMAANVACPQSQKAKQFVRVNGALSVDDRKTACWAGTCRAAMTDDSGSLVVIFKAGDDANHMGWITEPSFDQPLIVYDSNGQAVDNQNVSLVGITSRIFSISQNDFYCALIVYEVEPGK